MHFAGIFALLLTVWFAWDDLVGMDAAIEAGSPRGIAMAAVGLATPTAIQAGMAIHDNAEITVDDEVKPCAPHIPCVPTLHETAVTPPLLTFFD